MNPRLCLLPVLTLALLAAACSDAAPAPGPAKPGKADWPQWQGPNRDNISTETGLLKDWSKNKPTLLWTYRDAGIGYSAPAVIGDRLYVLGTDGEGDVVLALDAKEGKKIWSTALGTKYSNRYGGGPRATPTVDGDKIYGLTGSGELFCVEADGGKKVWQKNLQGRDVGGKMMSGWGYSESVLIDGDKLICTPGGRNGTLAAFDKKSGELLWRSKGVTHDATYSSAIVAKVGAVRHYIQQTRGGLVGVGEDGAV